MMLPEVRFGSIPANARPIPPGAKSKYYDQLDEHDARGLAAPHRESEETTRLKGQAAAVILRPDCVARRARAAASQCERKFAKRGAGENPPP